MVTPTLAIDSNIKQLMPIRSISGSLLLVAALSIACTAQTASAPPQQPQTIDVTQRLGPFKLNDQNYLIALRERVFLKNGAPALSGDPGQATLLSLQILDPSGTGVYQENFPNQSPTNYFPEALTASASTLGGQSSAAIAVRFIQEAPGPPGTEGSIATESWQVFGLAAGHLKLLGSVLPLGQGSNIAVGGVVTGVRVLGGIAVEPLATNAEILGFRAWTGNFYALVPVRMDWANGQWGEGEECYVNDNGTLRERGCSMAVEAQRQPQPNTVFVRLFAGTDGNSYNAQDAEVRPDSTVEFREVLAIVHWQTVGDRVACTFANLWLHVIVDGHEGWVHDGSSLEALGLPHTSPR